ncbi:MAG TPA: phosphotriesterase-related protein [Pseudonocardiaceae bacterium]|jgi:phosphotriesterase-related protein|nr:phosphotriesterase-related protein [Pseudonocardiaceae bacterium]
MASEVQTVGGAVPVGELGTTLMHEHLFVLSPDVEQNFPDEWGDEQTRVEEAVTALRRLVEIGVRTIVDPTVIGLGRYIPRIQAVAARVPELNIVVATGIYTYTEAPGFFRHRGPSIGRPEPMVDMFVKDITEGIAHTGVRAGLLKCAIDEPGLTPGVERVMRAVGEAHQRTGTPITVHTHPTTETGLLVKQVLVDEGGVDPARIVLGHSGDSTDVNHLSELADAGFTLGMDRMGLNTALTFEQRCDTVVELVRRGYAERMVLSHDNACHIDWIDPDVRPLLTQWHYLHIHEDVLPYLREHGVTEEQITTMMVDNPRRYFEAGNE